MFTIGRSFGPGGRCGVSLQQAPQREPIVTIRWPDWATTLQSILSHNLLVTASEFTGRRRRSFDARRCALRVAALLDDFSPLRQLSAFRALESDVQRIVRAR